MDDYLTWERKQTAFAFFRTAYRKARLKRRLDCGHVIDGSEPYRYQVWKRNNDTELTQVTSCEPCARYDTKV